MEDLDTRNSFFADPKGFILQGSDGAIFDEVQNTPELASYIQGIVDQSDKVGQFVLTGSQNFSISQTVSQSLAGRVGVTTLLPLSIHELSGTNWKDLVLKGGYPRLHRYSIDPEIFYADYLRTYIERDVRNLRAIGDLAKFSRFLKLLAGRIGQPVNLSSLGTDAEISHTTVNDWLSILEASYIIFRVPPFYKNFNKRLIKMPKLYFYDTGLACHLLEIKTQNQLSQHFAQGALFENMVMLELLKTIENNGQRANLYYWKNQSGYEIDCIIDKAEKPLAIEIKSSATPNAEFFRNLDYFEKTAGSAKKHWFIAVLVGYGVEVQN